jgi:hypothetical protein
MSDDMIMLLIRLAIIVVPTGITCFIAGYSWGRVSAYKEIDTWHPPAIDEPDFVEPVHYSTRLTSRDKTLEI